MTKVIITDWKEWLPFSLFFRPEPTENELLQAEAATLRDSIDILRSALGKAESLLAYNLHKQSYWQEQQTKKMLPQEQPEYPRRVAAINPVDADAFLQAKGMEMFTRRAAENLKGGATKHSMGQFSAIPVGPANPTVEELKKL